MDPEPSIREHSTEELKALYDDRGHGLTDDQMSRDAEPLGRIEVAPRVFQFRDPTYRPGEKEQHIRNLLRDLNRQQEPFEPIELFAVASHRLVLDGHCRLEAYRRAGLSETVKVPVRYFTGDFVEALTRPASENTKNKLSLSQREQLQAAWRLVLFDEQGDDLSLREIAAATGAGKSTVGKMRKILETEDQLGFDPRERTWKEVKTGIREEREVDENWDDKRVESWKHKLRRALGDVPNRTPDCLFRALEEGYPQLFPQMIPRHWVQDSGIELEILEERNEEFEDFAF